MKRITERMLQTRIDYLNQITGSPMTPYTKDKNGKYHANPGNYHMDMAYGGYKLVRMQNESGGISMPLSCGYETKRKLLEIINAYIAGVEHD